MAKNKDPMPPAKTPEPHAETICGSKTHKGGICKQRAGHRTDHPGTGRCWLHGGKTPIKHGRYSAVTRTRLAELIETFEKDPDPLNLLPDVLLLRALITDYVNRYDAFTEALLAWYESWKANGVNEGRPRQVLDILTVGKFIGDIGGLVEKIGKQRQEGMVSLATLDRVIEQLGVEMVNAAQEVIADADQRAALLKAVEGRWGTVRIDGKSGTQGTS